MKWRLLFIAVLILTIQNLYSQNKKLVVGYYNWDNSAYPHSAIDFSNLTHLCHAFIWPVADGNIDQGQIALYPDLINTAHSKGVKVLVSIGGYGTAAQTSGFKSMVNNATARTAFIKNLVNFVIANKYDGADFDLEYPTSADKTNFATLLVDVRKAFTDNNIPLLSAAVPATDWNGGYDVSRLKDVLDWVGLMTYDFTGPWDPVGTPVYHNSALYAVGKQAYSIDKSVTAWTGYGMPKSKICIGMPFYGYLMNASNILAGSTSTAGEKAVSYNTIASSYSNSSAWEYNFDNSTKTPYLLNTARTQVITFDDTVSTRMKCEYVQTKGLGGAIIWKIAQAYNGKSNPLLATAGQYLLKNVLSAVEEGKTIPDEFSLTSYPNPFNPSTNIQYTIPLQGNANGIKVRLSIFDMLGRLVTVLSDEQQSAGVHEITFNASHLSSGIYFCKLEAAGMMQTRKLILSK